MNPSRPLTALILGALYFLEIAMPANASAYVDPGTTGVLSQSLYVLYYAAIGVFLFGLRYIKQYFASVTQFFKRTLGATRK